MKKIFITMLMMISLTSNLYSQDEMIQKAHHKGKLIGYAVVTAMTIQAELMANPDIRSFHGNNCTAKLNASGLITSDEDLLLATKYCVAILNVEHKWEK